MKCKNPECNKEVKFDRQNNQTRKLFCSNLCCKEYHTDQRKNCRGKMDKQKIRQIIQKELLIWQEAYPRHQKVLGKFANKIALELELQSPR